MQHQARGLLPQGLCRVTGPQGCSAVLLWLLVCFPASCDPAPAQPHGLRKVAVGPGISPASGGLCSPGLMTNNPVSNTTCGIGASLAVLIKFQGAPEINGTEVVRSYKTGLFSCCRRWGTKLDWPWLTMVRVLFIWFQFQPGDLYMASGSAYSVNPYLLLIIVGVTAKHTKLLWKTEARVSPPLPNGLIHKKLKSWIAPT